MARSKSPAARKSSRAAPKEAAASDDNSALTGFTVAVILVVWYLTAGDKIQKDPLASLGKSAEAGFEFDYPFTIPIVSAWIGASCGFVKLLHCLNCIDRSNQSGFWLNSFTQTVIATYGGVIVTDIMTGTSMADAIFSASVPSLFFLWYLITQEIPFCPYDFGAWGKIKDLGGPVLQNLLDLGTGLFTTKMILAAVGASSPLFAPAWFKSIAMGCIAGTASNFFPFNKGVKFTKSADLSNALAISFFIASGGFNGIDSFLVAVFSAVGVESNPLPAIGALLTTHIVDHCGGATAFVYIVTLLNSLVGDLIKDVAPVKMHKGFDVFGLTAEIFSRAQLS